MLPNNVSRSTAVGAILHPGGPARSQFARSIGRSNSGSSLSGSNSNSGWSLSSGSPREEYPSTAFTFTLTDGSSGSKSSGKSGGVGVFGTGEFESGAQDVDFLLAVSSDEKLLRRLNEFDGSETVSTSGKGTDGKWTLDSEEAVKVLGMFAG